jgi:V/A-type H+-transporting ATPase subunit K
MRTTISRAWAHSTGLLAPGAFLLLAAAASASETAEAARPAATGDWHAVGLAFAAAFAIAISVLGAGYAVGRIGSAALGAAAEKPELLVRSLLFVALAEGLAVLGFAIAMILTQKI